MPFVGTKTQTTTDGNGGTTKTLQTIVNKEASTVTWSVGTEGAPFNGIDKGTFKYYDFNTYPAPFARASMSCPEKSDNYTIKSSVFSAYNPFIYQQGIVPNTKAKNLWSSYGWSGGLGRSYNPNGWAQQNSGNLNWYGSGDAKVNYWQTNMPDCLSYINDRMNEIYVAMGNSVNSYKNGFSGTLNAGLYWYNHRSEMSGDYKFHLALSGYNPDNWNMGTDTGDKSVPIPGSILIWHYKSTYEYSHVAFVEAVFKNSDGNWVIYFSESGSGSGTQFRPDNGNNPIQMRKFTLAGSCYKSFTYNWGCSRFLGWVETPVSAKVGSSSFLTSSEGGLTAPTAEETAVYAKLVKEAADSNFPSGTKVRVQGRCATAHDFDKGYDININGTICYIGDVKDGCYFPYQLVNESGDILAYGNRHSITKQGVS